MMDVPLPGEEPPKKKVSLTFVQSKLLNISSIANDEILERPDDEKEPGSNDDFLTIIPKPTLLGKQQAKKRLQAFGAVKQPVKKLPEVKKEEEKTRAKKVVKPDDRAKTTIEEIEKIKQLEISCQQDAASKARMFRKRTPPKDYYIVKNHPYKYDKHFSISKDSRHFEKDLKETRHNEREAKHSSEKSGKHSDKDRHSERETKYSDRDPKYFDRDSKHTDSRDTRQHSDRDKDFKRDVKHAEKDVKHSERSNADFKYSEKNSDRDVKHSDRDVKHSDRDAYYSDRDVKHSDRHKQSRYSEKEEKAKRNWEREKYPSDWKEMNSKEITIEQLKLIDSAGNKRSLNQQTEKPIDVIRMVKFLSPSYPMVPLKYNRVNGQVDTVPPQILRYTMKNGRVSYSENATRIKNIYFSRAVMFDTISKEQQEAIQSVITQSSYQKPILPSEPLTTRKWHPKTPFSPQCEIIEQSLGLSILQSYSDEDEVEFVRTEHAAVQAVKTYPIVVKDEQKKSKDEQKSSKDEQKSSKRAEKKKSRSERKRVKKRKKKKLKRKIDKKKKKKRKSRDKRKEKEKKSEVCDLTTVESDEKAEEEEEEEEKKPISLDSSLEGEEDDVPMVDLVGPGTPDTEEYHSHWESDEDLISADKVKKENCWESEDEELSLNRGDEVVGVRPVVKTYNRAERSLEMPLNINITRSRVLKEEEDVRKRGDSMEFNKKRDFIKRRGGSIEFNKKSDLVKRGDSIELTRKSDFDKRADSSEPNKKSEISKKSEIPLNINITRSRVSDVRKSESSEFKNKHDFNRRSNSSESNKKNDVSKKSEMPLNINITRSRVSKKEEDVRKSESLECNKKSDFIKRSDCSESNKRSDSSEPNKKSDFIKRSDSFESNKKSDFIKRSDSAESNNKSEVGKKSDSSNFSKKTDFIYKSDSPDFSKKTETDPSEFHKRKKSDSSGFHNKKSDSSELNKKDEVNKKSDSTRFSKNRNSSEFDKKSDSESESLNKKCDSFDYQRKSGSDIDIRSDSSDYKKSIDYGKKNNSMIDLSDFTMKTVFTDFNEIPVLHETGNFSDFNSEIRELELARKSLSEERRLLEEEKRMVEEREKQISLRDRSDLDFDKNKVIKEESLDELSLESGSVKSRSRKSRWEDSSVFVTSVTVKEERVEEEKFAPEPQQNSLSNTSNSWEKVSLLETEYEQFMRAVQSDVTEKKDVEEDEIPVGESKAKSRFQSESDVCGEEEISRRFEKGVRGEERLSRKRNVEDEISSKGIQGLHLEEDTSRKRIQGACVEEEISRKMIQGVSGREDSSSRKRIQDVSREKEISRKRIQGVCGEDDMLRKGSGEEEKSRKRKLSTSSSSTHSSRSSSSSSVSARSAQLFSNHDICLDDVPLPLPLPVPSPKTTADCVVDSTSSPIKKANAPSQIDLENRKPINSIVIAKKTPQLLDNNLFKDSDESDAERNPVPEFIKEKNLRTRDAEEKKSNSASQKAEEKHLSLILASREAEENMMRVSREVEKNMMCVSRDVEKNMMCVSREVEEKNLMRGMKTTEEREILRKSEDRISQNSIDGRVYKLDEKYQRKSEDKYLNKSEDSYLRKSIDKHSHKPDHSRKSEDKHLRRSEDIQYPEERKQSPVSASKRRKSPPRRRSRYSPPPSRKNRAESPRRRYRERDRDRFSPQRFRERKSPPYRRRSRSPRKETIQETLSRLAGLEPPPSRSRSPVDSPLDGFRKSLADSTISDEQLMQNQEHYITESPRYFANSAQFKSNETSSPQRIPLEERINRVLGIEKEEEEAPKPISTTYSHDYNSYNTHSYYDRYGSYTEQDYESKHFVGFAEEQKTERGGGVKQVANTSVTKVVQVGNVLQVVPTEEIPIPISKSTEKEMKIPQKILQVGNMLQIVPSPTLPVPDILINKEVKSAEEVMKQKAAELRAERDKRRLEREKRRKEKEKNRKEREKRRQLKMKQKTEDVIKRALLMETEGNEDELDESMDSKQWLSVSSIVNMGHRPVGKSILVRKGSNDIPINRQKKGVKFADGIIPGEGTSPSAGEELSSPPPMPYKSLKEKKLTKTKKPKKIKQPKKKIKVKVVKKSLTKFDDDEEDNLPPPSPPPGSPPPHIFPSRIKPIPNPTVQNFLPQIPQPPPQQQQQQQSHTTLGFSFPTGRSNNEHFMQGTPPPSLPGFPPNMTSVPPPNIPLHPPPQILGQQPPSYPPPPIGLHLPHHHHHHHHHHHPTPGNVHQGQTGRPILVKQSFNSSISPPQPQHMLGPHNG